MTTLLMRVCRAELRLACWLGGWCDVWADSAAHRLRKLSDRGAQ